MSDSFSPLVYETINLKLSHNTPYKFPDIFKDQKIQWSDPKSKNANIMEKLSQSNNWRDILPSELILMFTWKEVLALMPYTFSALPFWFHPVHHILPFRYIQPFCRTLCYANSSVL